MSQGCPLSPLLFQLAMSRVLRRGRAAISGAILSYLDDNIFVTCRFQSAEEAIALVDEDSARAHLVSNYSKWQVTARADSSGSFSAADVGTLDRLHQRGAHLSLEGLSLLGAPIGTDAFVAARVTAAFSLNLALIQRASDTLTFAPSGAGAEGAPTVHPGLQFGPPRLTVYSDVPLRASELYVADGPPSLARG